MVHYLKIRMFLILLWHVFLKKLKLKDLLEKLFKLSNKIQLKNLLINC
jgi:hypothetical protein